MNLLDRYIFRSVLLTCLGSVSLFAFVLMLGNAIRDLLGPLLASQLSLQTAGELVLLLIPFVISYALPMGILTGVLLVLGRLSADSEITAMRASGLSLGRIARPVFLLGTIGMGLGLYVNFQSMPWARVEYDKRFTAYVSANPLSFIVPKTFIRDFPGFVAYVGDQQGTVLRDFWLWQLDGQGRAQRFIHAESGRVDYDRDANSFILTLTQALIEDRPEPSPDRPDASPEVFLGGPPVATVDKTQPITLSLDGILHRSGPRQKPQWMTWGELRAEQDRLARKPVPEAATDRKQLAQDRMKITLVVQDKFTTAVAVLSFAVIGVPLGIRISRRETSAGLGVATMLALGYYFLTVMVGWLARHPEYRPDILYWLPNAVLLVLGVRLFRRLETQ